MGLTTIAQFPGTVDLDTQYTPGTNLHNSVGILHRMHGLYQFGAITADFFGMTGQARTNWLNEAGSYPDFVKDTIKDIVMDSLTHKKNNQDDPIQIKWSWTSDSGYPGVKVTYDQGDPSGTPPRGPSYMIQIFNLASPMASALASRRERKQNY
jgi:hypothetical protein